MFHNHFTQEFLGMEDVIVNNVVRTDKNIDVFIEVPKKYHNCPRCETQTKTIHDYRTQKIKDLAFGDSLVVINYKKRRYHCSCCNKNFYEDTSFLPRYHRMTSRLVAYVINALRDNVSFSYIAKKACLSTTTAIRLFDLVSYGHAKILPRVVSIDEFRGNAGNEKFQCILADPESGTIIDILPTRSKDYLIEYFKNCDCSNTEIFISDMYPNYKDIADRFFKKAMFVVDKFHYVRQTTWALETIRKEVQKDFLDVRRKYFKRSRKLLLKSMNSLNPTEVDQVEVMLKTSPKLRIAYHLKELLYKAVNSETRDEMLQHLKHFILKAQASNIPAFTKVAQTYFNWQKGILNSTQTPFTNAFIEGKNNKIKVIKRTA